jgi:hypothetical protein
MAGLSGQQTVIDVVAVSERLRPSAASSEPVPELELPPELPAEIDRPEPEPEAALPDLSQCALGHANHPDSRFCSSCGLPMGPGAPAAASGAPMARPKPADQLTPAERAEREREHAEAVAAAARFETAPQQFVPTEGEAVLIHFVADGLTAFGQVWYRGQELEIGPGHPRWGEALGWITLSKFQQIERWGAQKFDFGPWPGRRSYADAAGGFELLSGTDPAGNKVTITGPSEQQLRDADAAEARRGRAVPAPVFG